MRSLLPLFLLAAAAAGQEYAGPKPPKADVPYLVHADNLIETEQQTAIEEHKGSGKKEEVTYAMQGEASPVKTPLASPIFLMQAGKLEPEKLEVYKLEPRNGRREVTISLKRPAKRFPLTVRKIGEGLYRLETIDSLPNGEYVITPAGANQVFGFAVY